MVLQNKLAIFKSIEDLYLASKDVKNNIKDEESKSIYLANMVLSNSV